MHALKKILFGLGSLFLVLIALFAWLGVQSVRFKREEAPFVQAYVTDLSQRWDIADVYGRSADAFIAQASSAEGQRTIQRFKPLGTLTSIRDFELKNYSTGTWGRRGVFDFKADFRNGEALVEVTIVTQGNAGTRVLSINLNTVQINQAAAGRVSI
jgi:hypothetical protein